MFEFLDNIMNGVSNYFETKKKQQVFEESFNNLKDDPFAQKLKKYLGNDEEKFRTAMLGIMTNGKK